ncbi:MULTISPECIES: ABC transporter ATP-binding protein [Prosthecochloris]|nr:MULTISPECIES: ATP-binding cassette domain-containing protein [Prosthecochloris]UZJ38456.1 ATP-binding cassette domain-containing protein [Prosthecochloris sp. SCSIO W1103]
MYSVENAGIGMNRNLLELHDITAYRGKSLVFEGLSLAIPEGDSTVVLGPNGAGKTTLLKLISCDIYPVATKGSRLKILGRERWNVWELRSRFGIISHDLQHDYLQSAKGLNVILSGYYSSIDTWSYQKFCEGDIEKASLIMCKLGIESLAERSFGEMSVGQQRRFLLGRALINDPRALLLDEPTTGLDLKASFQYLDIVRSLIREGKTIILVTHHVHEIPPEIKRVVLIKNGRIFLDGEKTEVLTSSNLSTLFEIPLQVAVSNGFYQVFPG